MPDHVGQQLGSYQLIQMLGQGHWGSVYLGEYVHLRTQAAIKLLHGPWDKREVEGFLSEARTLASLRHPPIVRVLDFGVQQGTPFLVMEYAAGGTLRHLHFWAGGCGPQRTLAARAADRRHAGLCGSRATAGPCHCR